MAQFFDSDPAKAASNLRKHKVSFDEAQTTFADPRGLDVFDAEHSKREDRFARIGLSRAGRLLVVVYTERTLAEDSFVRLISARPATVSETQAYVRRP